MTNNIKKQFLELNKDNPKVKEEDLLCRMDGRLEWVCEHGVGHTVYAPSDGDHWWIHGCDGCCKDVKELK